MMSYIRLCFSMTITLLILAFGYPVTFVVTHGWESSAWPDVIGTPVVWFTSLARVDLVRLAMAYARMANGTSDAFTGGGTVAAGVITILVMLTWTFAFLTKTPPDDRRPNGPYGNARWANRRELGRLGTGVEIGIDPNSGKPVRLQIEGNLATIAPPRRGKTGGVVLPNLLACDEDAWLGPVVVIDPKGAAYSATNRRRQELNRRVLCVDPTNLSGGSDHWNPLMQVQKTDILSMQAIALVMLPDTPGQSESSAYFRSRSVDVLVGAMTAAINIGHPDLATVAELLMDRDRFLKCLGDLDSGAANAAREILLLEERARDGIMSSAQQATQYLRDERLRSGARQHTFHFTDLCTGNVDLFVIIPADARKDILAPYVRLLLGGLFAAVRETMPAERILVIIDEAYSLGYFSEILKGVGELPGYRLSIWTIWQSRRQMVEAYGEDGAEILLATAEVVTVFSLAAVQPDEVERWSRAIGSYTAEKIDWSPDPRTGKPIIHKTLEDRRLVPASDLPELLTQHQVAFINDGRLVHPLKMLRASAYTEPRFSGIIDL
jgi:type IV secretion system protein VirD4